ncbi:Aflatrem synthesis protein A [Ceratocystis fimbriata CBS 114723]|uniref:Aflatrem synthesis protein A n=1 Tax=Ceratocystis fimbriata CBS 114723 TaxID=1035309 RepID=A0A2C5X1U1_9PEZI|nr:Aflatrem synthesis protein A [Ceratocystis fimbriata CBS 114723]
MANPVFLVRTLWADPRPFLPTLFIGSFLLGGYYCIVDLQQHRGYFDLLGNISSRGILHDGVPLTREFTGIPDIDDIIQQVVVSSWPLASCKMPALTLFGLYYLGQLMALHSVVTISGLRAGNVQTIMALTTFWGIFYQCIPWGILMPVYWISFLWISPTATAKGLVEKVQTSYINIAAAMALPYSVIGGFIVPSALASLPASIMPSHSLKQLLVAVWHLYPVYISTLQFALTELFKLMFHVPVAEKQSAEQRLAAQKRMYTLLANIASLVHLGVLWFILSPSLVSRLGFSTDSPWTKLSFRQVFVPGYPTSQTPFTSVTEGTLAQLQYDLLFATGSSIAFALYRDGFQPGRTLIMLQRITLYGPAGAVLMWEKEQDEIVLRAAMQIEKADKEHKE